MARKHHAKHSKNTILASSTTKPFSKLSVGAASAVVGASLALSAAPALAQTAPAPADAQQTTPTTADNAANSVKPGTVKQESVKSVENKQVGGVILVKPLRQTQRFRKLLLQKVLIVQLLLLHLPHKLTVK